TGPNYLLDVAGSVDLNDGVSSGQALFVNGKEALWSNGTYFSWGYGNSYNAFVSSGVSVGTSTAPSAGGLLAAGMIYSQDAPTYAQTYLHTWGLGGNGTIYIEPTAGGTLNLTDDWSATGNLNIEFGQTNFQNASGTVNAYITKNGMAEFLGGISSLGGNNIGDIPGGVGIGNVSTGWYSDSSNLSARFPGSSGCFYVQNSGGGTTYLTSGLCNTSGGTVVYGPLTSNGLMTAGSNMPGGTDEFHITNTTGNAYLYAYSTAGTSATIGAWSGSGGVPLILGGSGVTIGGVTRSAWPGSNSNRETFTSGSNTTNVFQGVWITIGSWSVTLASQSNLLVTAYASTLYTYPTVTYNWNGSQCTSNTIYDYYDPGTLGIDVDGTVYDSIESPQTNSGNATYNNGFPVTISTIIPNLSAGSHTIYLVAQGSVTAPNGPSCTSAGLNWGGGSLSYAAF
ncbi:MAG: hypothetical protein KGJ01_03590, partial [Patescibacteria group bacterium]|nr:hypothetical protein [Patescibacteria group bacterium]